jgi:penicillin-binding protein-related factor A (putative recombinase)
MAKYERVFSAQVRKELKQTYGDECFVQLLPDMRRTGKKPFDFFFVYKSIFHAVECKLSTGRSFNIVNDIRPHQIPCLYDVEKSGGKSFFLICFGKLDLSFICTPSKIEYMEEKLKSDKLTIEDFENFAVKMQRLKIGGKTRWEVEKMVEAFL